MDIDRLSAKFMSDFINKLNRASDNNFFSDEKDALIYQVVLLHLYTDFIMEKIKEKNNLKGDWRFSSKLNALYNSKILDEDGYKALKLLNDFRNDLAHKFDIDFNSIRKDIEKLRKLKIMGDKEVFDKMESLVEKLELACIHYINALRTYILTEMGNEADTLPVQFSSINGKEIYLFFGTDVIKEGMLKQYKETRAYLKEKYGKGSIKGKA